jgi:hypothetical protein
VLMPVKDTTCALALKNECKLFPFSDFSLIREVCRNC